MEAITLTKREMKYFQNFESDRYLFRIYNAQRPAGHSANKILRDNNEGKPWAVHCNCGKFHPVFTDQNTHTNEYSTHRTKVDWDTENKSKDQLLKEIKLKLASFE